MMNLVFRGAMNAGKITGLRRLKTMIKATIKNGENGVLKIEGTAEEITKA